jgi:aspartyl-tRNA(Asn)/glutamyl-tRNA(Gln) amidotransferase subunit C
MTSKAVEPAVLTPEEVAQIALLARLELSGDDLNTMARQLSSIIAYVRQLQELDTDQVEPLAHPLPIQNVFRDDEPAPSLPVDVALANAPNRQGDFYSVPAVKDTGESEA